MKVFYIGSPEDVMDGLIILAGSPQEAAKALGGVFIFREKDTIDPSESSKLIGIVRFNRNLFDPPIDEEESRLSLGNWIYRCGIFMVFLNPEEDECADEELWEMPFIMNSSTERSLESVQCN